MSGRQQQTFTARRGDNYYCCHYLAAGRSRRRLCARVELAWDFNVNYFRLCYENKIKREKKGEKFGLGDASPRASTPRRANYVIASGWRFSKFSNRIPIVQLRFCRSSVPSWPDGDRTRHPRIGPTENQEFSRWATTY